MAISVDVLPKIDPAAFTQSVKLGIAESMLTVAHDNLPQNSVAAAYVRRALSEIDKLTKESED